MTTLWRWIDRVIPVAVKLVSCDADRGHLGVGNGHPVGIAAPIDLRSDTEARPPVRRGNQAHDRGETHERRAAPVHGDVRKQAMFDLVPLARARWEMTNG